MALPRSFSSGEVKDFLGLKMGAVPADFVGKWEAYAANAPSIAPEAVAVGAAGARVDRVLAEVLSAR